jgi:hypothetical protein
MPYDDRDEMTPEEIVKDAFERAENGMALISYDWLANKLFNGGEQWLEADGVARGNLVRTANNDNDRRNRLITINVYQAHVRTIISKLIAQQPIPVVTPATSSSDDRATARACEHLLKYFWRSKQLQQEYIYLVTDMTMCGGGWWYCDWDPDAGEMVDVVADASELEGEPESKQVRTGDVVTRFVSNFEMRVDPGANRWQDAKWCGRVYPLGISEIHEKYGIEVSPDWPTSNTAVVSPDYWMNPQRLQDNRLCAVREMWHLPCEEYPKGAHWMVIADNLVVDEPLRGEVLPFEYAEFMPDPDNFYGSTPMSFARQPQRQLNTNITLICEGRNRNLFGTWLAARGAQMDTPTGKAGEILGYNDNARQPEFVRQEPISPQIFQFSQLLADSMSLTTGIGMSALGDQSAATSGKDRLYAAEEDNTKLGITLQCLHAFLKRIAMKVLNNWRDNATLPLKYAVGDPNAMGDIQEFDAANITYRDVEMSIDSTLPLNRQARREEILALYQGGLIDQAKALKLMEFGDVDEAIGSKNLDVERARNENQLLYIQDIQAQEWEDHAAHLEQHLSEIKQQKAYDDIAAQQRINNHMMQHKMFLQMALGMGGAVPPEGQSEQGLTDTASFQDNQTGDGSLIPNAAPVSPRDEQALAIINGRAA